MSESLQHKLDRVRKPRVQITYDVENYGKMVKKELPFVVGVLADLSGQPKTPLKPMAERSFSTIDRDNFNQVMARQAPRLAMKVKDVLSGNSESMLNVELNFKEMGDFDPEKVATQIGPLKELLETRNKLNQLLSKMEGNDKLEGLLEQILKDQNLAGELAKKVDGSEVK